MKPLAGLVAILAAAMAAGVFWGQVQLFPLSGDAWGILWNFRLPRVLFAGLNGASLALAGVLYQIALRNPLADGFTTGAASSAALGGCLGLALWGSPLVVSTCAVVCAGLGMLVVRGIAARAGDGARISIILAGIALSVVAGSGIGFLKYFFEDSVGTMVFWLMGGLSGATWPRAGVLAVLLALAVLALQKRRAGIALLYLDDHSAQAAGVDVRAMRAFLYVLTTILVAISVSFCGVIGFLGLMIPHAARALLGHTLSAQLVGAPLLGATALVVFDLLSRVVLPHGGELPVGIMTSAVGGIFFFLLLMRKGNSLWGS